MATFRKTASGGVQAIIRRKGFEPRSAVFDTKAEARAWATQIEAEMLTRRVGGTVRKKVHELLTHFADEIAPTRKGGRWETIRLKALTPKLGFADYWIEDVQPAHCAQWMAKRSKDVEDGTLLREVALLSSVWHVARIELRWATTNPWRDTRKPKQPKARKRRIEPAEVDALVLATGYQRGTVPQNKTQMVGLVFLVALETAMRAGELCGLTWDRVHLDARYVHLDTTKNGHERDVPLTEAAGTLLALLPRGKPGAPVFGITASQLDGLFRKVRDHAAIEQPALGEIHFHDARREATSRLAALPGMDVMALGKITGHRTLKVLQNVYYAPKVDDLVKKLGPASSVRTS